jgi:hypothetical protein
MPKRSSGAARAGWRKPDERFKAVTSPKAASFGKKLWRI